MYEIESRVLAVTPTLVMTTKTGLAGIPGFLARAYAETARFIENSGAKVAGPCFARYRLLGDPDGDFEIEAGFPLMGPAAGEGEIVASTLPGGDVAVTMHVGPYETMEAAYSAIKAWVKDHDGQPAGPAWEVYYSDPAAEPDSANWRTEIYQPYV